MPERLSKTPATEGATEFFGDSAEVLQALPAAVYTTDAAGNLTFYNEAAVELWGCRPMLGNAQWCGSWRLYWPDGRPMPHDECPMALALKNGQPLRAAEAVAERPDGSRVPFLAYPTPRRDHRGTLTGAVNMLVDISDRKSAEISKQFLATIVESSDDAIVSKDLNGIITSWNRGAERIFGYTCEEVVGKPITMLIPSDRHVEEDEILSRIRRGERVDHYETVRQRKDGSLINVSLTVSPVRGIEGRIMGASKIARDITESKKSREVQHLLLQEMNHRVKNVFALASAVVMLSARTMRVPQGVVDAIRQRLRALSQAHELTLPPLTEDHGSRDRSASLHALLRTIVSPYVDSTHECDERIVMNGPDVMIGARAATNLALLLHELATNAAKYGSLSSPAGRVAIDWVMQDDYLVLEWKEIGGPPIDRPPDAEGFGNVLTRATVGPQLGGWISRDWKPEGLAVRLSVRLDCLAA